MEKEKNTNEKGFGGIIGAIIIIAILVAGGWFFIGGRVKKIQNQKAANDTTIVGDVTTGTSTEITDIETDLNNVNLKALDLP